MKTQNMTNLERTVYGVNLINKLTVENLNLVVPQLETYLNKKVCLVNGNYAKSFKIDFLKYSEKSEGQLLRTYIRFEGTSVYLFQDVTVKTADYPGGGYGVEYFKNTIHLGTLKDGILVNIENVEQLINSCSLLNVFCAKEVKQTKDKIKKKKKETSELESLIYQFKNTY